MVNILRLQAVSKNAPVRAFLKEFSLRIIQAQTPEEYLQDPRKVLFDQILQKQGIIELRTESYLEDVTTIYKNLA